MIIIYVGSFRMPNMDAAAARVLNNAKAMKLLGHTIKFLSWGGNYRDSDLCEDGIYRIDGMEYIITNELDATGSLAHRMNSLLHRGNKSMEYIKQEKQKPNLIILYNADKRWTERLLKYCHSHHIFLADDITEWYDDNELHPWNIIPYHINMTRTQHKVKNKILISSYLNNYYREGNNLLLPPLCDQKEDKWSKTIVDDRVLDFDGVTLFYAGNPAKKDCVHIVINVVNNLANDGMAIRFIIVGITRESYIKRYHSQLQAMKLHENIIFLGKISQDMIPAYYKFADFMVLLREPSRKNMAGFPTKFAESISASVPVIANDTSDLNRYITDGYTGFNVSAPTAEALKDVLESKVLQLNREKILEMKQRVQSLQSVFDYRTYIYNINQFLNNLR